MSLGTPEGTYHNVHPFLIEFSESAATPLVSPPSTTFFSYLVDKCKKWCTGVLPADVARLPRFIYIGMVLFLVVFCAVLFSNGRASSVAKDASLRWGPTDAIEVVSDGPAELTVAVQQQNQQLLADRNSNLIEVKWIVPEDSTLSYEDFISRILSEGLAISVSAVPVQQFIRATGEPSVVAAESAAPYEKLSGFLCIAVTSAVKVAEIEALVQDALPAARILSSTLLEAQPSSMLRKASERSETSLDTSPAQNAQAAKDEREETASGLSARSAAGDRLPGHLLGSINRLDLRPPRQIAVEGDAKGTYLGDFSVKEERFEFRAQHHDEETGATNASGPSSGLSVGQSFSAYLDSNPSTGYNWDVSGAPTNAASVESTFISRSQSDGGRGPLVGTPVLQKVTFKWLKPGSYLATLRYRRPWETGVEPIAEKVILFEIRQEN